jgi:hypothetical protein
VTKYIHIFLYREKSFSGLIFIISSFLIFCNLSYIPQLYKEVQVSFIFDKQPQSYNCNTEQLVLPKVAQFVTMLKAKHRYSYFIPAFLNMTLHFLTMHFQYVKVYQTNILKLWSMETTFSQEICYLENCDWFLPAPCQFPFLLYYLPKISESIRIPSIQHLVESLVAGMTF